MPFVFSEIICFLREENVFLCFTLIKVYVAYLIEASMILGLDILENVFLQTFRIREHESRKTPKDIIDFIEQIQIQVLNLLCSNFVTLYKFHCRSRPFRSDKNTSHSSFIEKMLLQSTEVTISPTFKKLSNKYNRRKRSSQEFFLFWT